jgi:UV excision repair protein RAD23
MGGAGGSVGGLDLSALQNNPQLQQLRQLVQQNPQLIGPILQQLAQNNPGLATAIEQNPQGFLQLLGAGGLGGEGAEGDDPAHLSGAQVVSVTAEEMAAIERVSHSLHFCRRVFVLICSIVSCKALVSAENKPSKLSLHAIRMKNWRLTICSIWALSMRSK